jgi:hypothetical protein
MSMQPSKLSRRALTDMRTILIRTSWKVKTAWKSEPNCPV